MTGSRTRLRQTTHPSPATLAQGQLFTPSHNFYEGEVEDAPEAVAPTEVTNSACSC